MNIPAVVKICIQKTSSDVKSLWIGMLGPAAVSFEEFRKSWPLKQRDMLTCGEERKPELARPQQGRVSVILSH